VPVPVPVISVGVTVAQGMNIWTEEHIVSVSQYINILLNFIFCDVGR